MHSRLDSYSLQSEGQHWFLYLCWPEDEGDEGVDNSVVARMPKTSGGAIEAAKLLLAAFWQYDNSVGDCTGRFHSSTPGLLTGDDLKGISDEVWGQPHGEE